MGRTILTDDEFIQARVAVLAYLSSNESINNREFRALTHFGYDQAISFFGRMVRKGHLRRMGKASGTKYVLRKAPRQQ